MPAHSPSVDAAALAGLLDLGTDFVIELAGDYEQQYPGLVDRLRAAVATGNAVEVVDTAHMLKSSSAYLGLVEPRDMAKAMETAGRAGMVPTSAMVDTIAQAAADGLRSLRQSINAPSG